MMCTRPGRVFAALPPPRKCRFGENPDEGGLLRAIDALPRRHDLPEPRGIYWTPSPIFLHARDCPRAETVDELAPIVRANALVSIRAYDAEHLCLYDLGQVCAGSEAEGPLLGVLADPRTRFVNVHTARPGCLLVRVERVPG